MFDATLLKKLREKNGLTQKQVADYLFMDRSTYAYYEIGQTRINIEMLVHLARLYRVDLNLFTGETPPREASDAGVDMTAVDGTQAARFSQLGREERNLIIRYRAGTPARREAFLKQAEEIVGAASQINLA